MKYKIKNHIIDAKSPVEALKIHKLLDSVKDAKNYKIYQKTPWGEVFIAEWEHNSKEEAVKEFLEFNPKYANRGVIIAKDSVKDAEPTYRSVWLKVKEYVKSHYNFKYSRDFSGLMNWLNTQYGGILDEDEVYKILRDLNSKGYVMFITDSQEELDYLTEEEERAVDDYRQAIENTTNPKLLKLYQHILEEELEHIEELTSAEVVEDSCKTKDMRLPDYKETAIYLHSLSNHITQMSRSEEFSKQEAVKFVNDVEREANSIINKAKQEINTLSWIK